ncbi:MAG: hypothetical protein AB8H86_22910 [Polyangiales bacterium]
MKPWIRCCVAAWAISIGSAAANAQPLLRVRAETRIDLRVVDGRVVGSLLDDVASGLPSQRLTVVLSKDGVRQRVVVTTDGEGAFEITPSRALPLDVDATFDGDGHFERSSATRRLERAPTTVRFRSEERSFNLDETTHTIVVEVSGPESSEQELVLRNELGHLLGRSSAGPTATWTIASPELGPTGAGAFKVVLQDEAERVFADSEVRVVRFRQPVIALERVDAAASSTLMIRGRMEDSAGPLRRRALTVFVDNERVDTLLSDGEGTFEWETLLEPGAHTLYVRFESDQVGHPSTESETLEIVVGGDWAAELWFILPFALFALFALWLRRSRPEPSPALLEPVVRGVSLQIPAKTTRTRQVSGRLKDLIDGSSKPGHVRAVPADGDAQEFEIAQDGSFSFELAAGSWRLVFGSPGHAPEILDLRSPHDGRFENMSVRLENWRHRAVRVLRRAARGVLGRRDLTSTTVHQLRREPEIAEIASDVEAIAYGAGERDGAAIGALEEKAAQIVGPDDRTR